MIGRCFHQCSSKVLAFGLIFSTFPLVCSSFIQGFQAQFFQWIFFGLQKIIGPKAQMRSFGCGLVITTSIDQNFLDTKIFKKTIFIILITYLIVEKNSMKSPFSDRTPAEIEVRTASLARSWPSVEESLVLSFLPRPTKSKSSSSHPWTFLSWPSFNLGPDLENFHEIKD